MGDRRAADGPVEAAGATTNAAVARLGEATGTGPPRDADPSALTYRPHLDGLRAVAVYLVVAFHAGLDRARGGFVGVDVFFVLSGFLVTRTLLHDVEGAGGVRFSRFYFRRVRRLLPAALVNLVVTAVVFSSMATARELADARSVIQSAALWYSNWHFIRVGADYFGAGITSSPVAQYWSLSVEEQVYLTWPLLLGLALAGRARAGWRWQPVVATVVAVVGGASLVAALAISRTDVDRAYYGTDTRAYQILLGAGLALAPGALARLAGSARGRRMADGASVVLVGLLVLVASWLLDVGPVGRGVVAAALAVALVAALEVAPHGLAGRALSLRPIVWLGQISYGTYLWHWLVILVIERQVEMDDLTTAVVTAVVATALAGLSMELLERPVRTWTLPPHHRRVTIALGVTASLLVGVAVAPRLLDRGGSAPSVAAPAPVVGGGGAAGGAGTPNRTDADQMVADMGAALARCPRPELCTIVEGSQGTILLAGDSQAIAAAETFEEVARAHDLELVTWMVAGCPWVRGIEIDASSDDCAASQDRLQDEVLAEVEPDLLVLVQRPLLEGGDPSEPPAIIDRDRGELRGDAGQEALSRRTEASVRALRDQVPGVVLIEPTPVPRDDLDPAACLATASVLEECRYVAAVDGPTEQDLVLRRLAEDDDQVWSLDIDTAVCPYLPICDPVVGGEVVKFDGLHLTIGFATSLGPVVDRYLVDAQVLPLRG